MHSVDQNSRVLVCKALAAFSLLLFVNCNSEGTTLNASTGDFCDEYADSCPNETAGTVFHSVCKEECTNGPKPAFESLRESTCWKAYCRLELNMCLSVEEADLQAVRDCAAKHGWLKE